MANEVDFEGHCALVTGATGGIGRAICLSLASMGCNIILHYYSSSSEAEQLKDELIKQHGIGVGTIQADLGSYDDVIDPRPIPSSLIPILKAEFRADW